MHGLQHLLGRNFCFLDFLRLGRFQSEVGVARGGAPPEYYGLLIFFIKKSERHNRKKKGSLTNGAVISEHQHVEKFK